MKKNYKPVEVKEEDIYEPCDDRYDQANKRVARLNANYYKKKKNKNHKGWADSEDNDY